MRKSVHHIRSAIKATGFVEQLTAKRTTAKTIAKIINSIHALFRADFWYLFACSNSLLASRVLDKVFCTFPSIDSIIWPCSLTMVPRSLNISLSSLIPCSICLMSSSRSLMSISWKSTSLCSARAICCCTKGTCSCCCCDREAFGEVEW